MKHRIRPATQSERNECIRQWVSSFSPHARKVDGLELEGVTVGSPHRSLAPYLWKRAHTSLVQSILHPGPVDMPARLDVLVIDTMPNEPLGWTCLAPESGEIHYVYVVDKARRRKLGTQLLIHASEHGAWRPTCTTASGIGLFARVQPSDPNADTKPIDVRAR